MKNRRHICNDMAFVKMMHQEVLGAIFVCSLFGIFGSLFMCIVTFVYTYMYQQAYDCNPVCQVNYHVLLHKFSLIKDTITNKRIIMVICD